jgi:hypothetical protein
MSPVVRMLNGTLELNGFGAVKEHYARIWGAMRESLNVERFVSDSMTVAIEMHTHLDVLTDDPASPFGQILAIEGEMVFALDDSETVLRRGDVVVQRGTSHRWENRSGRVARMVFVQVDAEFAPDLIETLGVDVMENLRPEIP